LTDWEYKLKKVEVDKASTEKEFYKSIKDKDAQIEEVKVELTA